MMTSPNLYLPVLVIILASCSSGLPVGGWPRGLAKRDVGSGIEVPPPEILKFMRRFGYLEPSPADAEALYHESAIVEAIKNVQKYGALNQTGKLNSETLELLSKPRCGVSDIEGTPYYLSKPPSTGKQRLDIEASKTHRTRDKRFVIGARTWTKRHLRYYIANESLKVSRQQVERDIRRALALWARHSGLRFERVNYTSADITVGFGSRYHGDNYPFDGPGNILAHAFYPYEMGSWGGDVHFDEDENWQENSTDLTNGVDFYSVAVHELGHSLGLAHSPVFASIMFPYYKGSSHSVSLDYDDSLAMYEMYLNKRLEDDDEDFESSTTAELPTTQVESTTDGHASTTTSRIENEFSTPTFHGDYETIAQHKHRYVSIPTATALHHSGVNPTTTLAAQSEIPDICQGRFDAVTVINGSVHIFKQEYVWKLTPRYTISDGYPLSIHEMFPFLPAEVREIDAAFERYDGTGVLFTGSTYWMFKGLELVEDTPKSLTALLGSTASSLEKVDAVFMWPKNNFTYLFAGARFWRYDDRQRRLEPGYPKSMRRWLGIPNDVDAAAVLANGKTYFFKDNIYWLYNNNFIRPERGYPRRASTAWLGCVAPTKTPLRNFNTTVSFISSSVSRLT